MPLISPEYRTLQEELHGRAEYGVTAPRFMPHIAELATAYKVDSIVDYGSGPREHVKTLLAKAGAPFEVQSYDPGVPRLSTLPSPADMLVSCDVLEHIEPDRLSDVLDHMVELAQKVAFLTIATGPAKKTLADGRNAHLIQQGPKFWLPLLMEHWNLKQFFNFGHELICICEALEP